MNKLSNLYKARRMIAKRLFFDYPNAVTVDDLPQDLVHSFDVITDMIGWSSTGRYLAYFADWWNVRKSLRDTWHNG